MFGTIIIDSYKKEEVEVIAKCLDEICSPLDSYGWASAGIYSFWDYESKEILYIGLASDLGVRFRQHNGILHTQEGSCKYKQIQEYFRMHEKIGYTIFVQSTLSQPIVHNNETLFRKYLNRPKGMPVEDYGGEEGLENIKNAEGQLIEAYRLAVGKIPPWNRIGGSTEGRKGATQGNYFQIVREFATGNIDNFLVSRSTLRELAENPTYEWFEEQLHTIRMCMLTMGESFNEALKIQKMFNPAFEESWIRIVKEKYLDKELVV